MPPTLDELLTRPADERADLAMALWASLTDDQRDAAIPLQPEQREAIDRRWSTHLEVPAAALPWDSVRKTLRNEP
jgi:putative addiction module component (TIGR02574 family)